MYKSFFFYRELLISDIKKESDGVRATINFMVSVKSIEAISK